MRSESKVAPEFSDGELIFLTGGLTYGFRVLHMPKMFDKVVFYFPTGGSMSDGGYSPQALP